MHVAEEILDAFEVVGPLGIKQGQKIFGGVAEAFEADAKRVPELGTVVAKGAAVESAGCFPVLEREVLRHKAIGDEAAGAFGETAGPEGPLRAVESAEGFDDLGAKFRLASGEDLGEGLADRIGFVGEAVEPFLKDLQIAKIAEAAEKFAAGFAHLVPGGIGVNLSEAGSHGAAAAEGNTEIVHGVGGGIAHDKASFARNALHPVA